MGQGEASKRLRASSLDTAGDPPAGDVRRDDEQGQYDPGQEDLRQSEALADGWEGLVRPAAALGLPIGLPSWGEAPIAEPQDLIAPAFEVLRPARQTVPIVFNTPHSGRAYPAGFLRSARLGLRDLRGSEDAFVDTLLEGVVQLGAPLLRAHFPRAYLDVNREPFELDPRLFGPLPPYANGHSLRVAAGLGTIARVVADAKEIYADPPSLDEAMARIAAYYVPYHRALRQLVAETVGRFGVCLLIDGHSMPSLSRIAGPGSSSVAQAGERRAHFVLGDRHGASCSPAVMQAAHAALARRGHLVSRNAPYAGGYITEHYGRPGESVHVLQVEINRGLYMDEARIAPNRRFGHVADSLMALAEALVALDPEAYLGLPIAAE